MKRRCQRNKLLIVPNRKPRTRALSNGPILGPFLDTTNLPPFYQRKRQGPFLHSFGRATKRTSLSIPPFTRHLGPYALLMPIASRYWPHTRTPKVAILHSLHTSYIPRVFPLQELPKSYYGKKVRKKAVRAVTEDTGAPHLPTYLPTWK